MNENTDNRAKAFELRTLTADDMFPMFNIISKIGIKEFKHCFESADVRKAISDMASKKDSRDEVSGDESQVDLTAIGMTIALDLAGVILANVSKCKDDIYLLLSQLSGMSKKEIANLPMSTFMEMIIAVIKKDEFKDFFQAVSKLFR